MQSLESFKTIIGPWWNGGTEILLDKFSCRGFTVCVRWDGGTEILLENVPVLDKGTTACVWWNGGT